MSEKVSRIKVVTTFVDLQTSGTQVKKKDYN